MSTAQPLQLTPLDAFGEKANFAETPKHETIAQRRRREQQAAAEKEAAKLKAAQEELTLPDSPAAMLKGIPARLWKKRTATVKGEEFTYKVFDSDSLYKTPRRTYQASKLKQNEVEL